MNQEQLVRSFYDAMNSHNFEKFTSFFSDDGQFKDVSTDHVYRGKAEIRKMAEGWLKALPDMKFQVSNVIGSGDVLCAELSLVGTQTGPMQSPQGLLPASGKKINVPSCDIIRLKNGKIESLSCYYAATILLNQIGAASVKRAA
ncbi:ester cyclase [Bdellovibrionota bacterium FG-1]